MRNIFVGVDERDVNGEMVKLSKPFMVKADTIIKYQINGIPTKPGDDFEVCTFDIWTSDGEHYAITDTEKTLAFMEKVTINVDD